MKMKWTSEKIMFWLVIIFGICVTLYVGSLALLADDSALQSQKTFLFFQMILGLATIFVPNLISWIMKINIPGMINIYYWIFIVFSVFIGTGLQVIASVHYWDKILHISSSMLIVAVGYGIMGYLLPNSVVAKVPPLFYVIFGFAFGLAGGVIWEFYEFTCDALLNMNLQRYAEGGKELVGRAALMDTMGDLLIDALGSLLFSIFCFLQSKRTANFFKKLAFEKRIKK